MSDYEFFHFTFNVVLIFAIVGIIIVVGIIKQLYSERPKK